jgi:hypothetical protein
MQFSFASYHNKTQQFCHEFCYQLKVKNFLSHYNSDSEMKSILQRGFLPTLVRILCAYNAGLSFALFLFLLFLFLFLRTH